jgi:hypothetical protein
MISAQPGNFRPPSLISAPNILPHDAELPDYQSLLGHERLVQRGRKILLMAPQTFINFDAEFDGIPGYGNLLSIGAKAITGEEFYREIKPLTPYTFIPAQREFCESHGLSIERLLSEAPDFREVMVTWHDWLTGLEKKTHKQNVLAAFNAADDFAWMELYYQMAFHQQLVEGQVQKPWALAPFDIKSYALALGDTHDWRLTGKNHLPAFLRPESEFTHNALDDAIFQEKIHCAVVAYHEFLHRDDKAGG